MDDRLQPEVESGGEEVGISTVEFEDLETTQNNRTRVVHSLALGKPTTVYGAAAVGDLDLVKHFIEVEGQPFIEADQWDATPLYYACLCGHIDVVLYLLERGATAAPDTFDGERCYYAAIDDDIRNLLKTYSAANKQRGSLFAYLFRIFNTPKFGRSDIVFHVVHDHTKLYAHKSILASRSVYFAHQFRTKWKNRTEINLTDTRMKGIALKAVIEYIYTERLVTTVPLLPDIQILAKNLKLPGLQYYLQTLDIPTLVQKANQSFFSNRIMAKDLGPLYKTGSYPLFGLVLSSSSSTSNENTNNLSTYENDVREWHQQKSSWFDSSLSINSDTKRTLVENSLRVHFWNNLLRKGTVPEKVFLHHQACVDYDDNNDPIFFGNHTIHNHNNSTTNNENTFQTEGTIEEYTDLHHDLQFSVKGYLFRAHSAIVCGRSKFLESLVSFHTGAVQDSSSSGGIVRTTYPLATTSDSMIGSSNTPSSASSLLSSHSSVPTIPLHDVSPFVFGVLLEWMYCDVVRPFPTPALVHEAIVAVDFFVLNDGIKPLLVARAIPHIQLTTVIPTLALADVYNLHRLTVAAAGFVAIELESILQLPEFEELVRASAASITSRQEYDSVPVLDEIKSEIVNIFSGKTNVYGTGILQEQSKSTETRTNVAQVSTSSTVDPSYSLTLAQASATTTPSSSLITSQLLHEYARTADDMASQLTGRVIMNSNGGTDNNDEVEEEDKGMNGIDTVNTETSHFDDRLQWNNSSSSSSLRTPLPQTISTIINERKNIDSQNNILKLVFTGRMQQNDVLAAVQQGLPPEGWKALSLHRMTDPNRTDTLYRNYYGSSNVDNRNNNNKEVNRRLQLVDNYAHSLGFKMRR